MFSVFSFLKSCFNFFHFNFAQTDTTDTKNSSLHDPLNSSFLKVSQGQPIMTFSSSSSVGSIEHAQLALVHLLCPLQKPAGCKSLPVVWPGHVSWIVFIHRRSSFEPFHEHFCSFVRSTPLFVTFGLDSSTARSVRAFPFVRLVHIHSPARASLSFLFARNVLPSAIRRLVLFRCLRSLLSARDSDCCQSHRGSNTESVRHIESFTFALSSFITHENNKNLPFSLQSRIICRQNIFVFSLFGSIHTLHWLPAISFHLLDTVTNYNLH